jgi:hypothetical protein
VACNGLWLQPQVRLVVLPVVRWELEFCQGNGRASDPEYSRSFVGGEQRSGERTGRQQRRQPSFCHRIARMMLVFAYSVKKSK